MDSSDRTIPVVIVGSGAAALALALVLTQQGVEPLLVDGVPSDGAAADAARVGGGATPESVGLERPALQVLARLGAGTALAAAQVVSRTRVIAGHREVVTTHGDGDSGGALLLAIEPDRLRQRLSDLVSERGLPRVETSTSDVRLSVLDEGVSVATRGPAGQLESHPARYAVVTDDAVAARLGLPTLTPGRPAVPDTEQTGFVVADIRADLPFSGERRLYVDPPWDPGGRLLLRPQTPTVWRVEWLVSTDSDPAESVAVQALTARLDAVADGTPYEILRAGHYRTHRRVATAFRAGPVFRMGDAAHSCSTVGADNLGAAIEDAENLGWKLAYVLRGEGGDQLLDSYDAERRPAIEAHLAASPQVRVLATRGPSWRERALPARLRRPSAPPSGLPLQEPVTYRSSPVLQPGAGGVAPELPVLGTGGQTGQLSDLRGGPLIVLAIGPTQDEAVGLAAAVETALAVHLSSSQRQIDCADTLPPHRFVGGAAADATEGLDAAGTALGNLLVVRPDGRVAWKVNGEDAPEEVAGALVEAMLRTVGR